VKSVFGVYQSHVNKTYTNEYLNDRALFSLQIEPKKVVEIKVVVSLASNRRD
jgi:hypothetical protein